MSSNINSTFYFYDLETSGFDPRFDRIMQFGGQRTDFDLKPVGKPDCFYIKITEDILPDPYAAIITGITPQKTIKDGISETEFIQYFQKEIALPNTVFVGFNSIRFDDEFMRFTNYRNFADAYTWQWQDGKSRWDILDLTRMTRALRPKGINWPVDKEGKPTNRLELLAKANNLNHKSAHDALSDVEVTIEIARMIKRLQPKLFDYLLNMRDKKIVKTFVLNEDVFVYCSGKYSSEFEKTTVASCFVTDKNEQSAWVYDLRVDPNKYSNYSVEQITNAMKYDPTRKTIFPVKKLSFNKCPAVAPLSVLDENSMKRLKINIRDIEKNKQNLEKSNKLKENFKKVIEAINQNYSTSSQDVDGRLYESFVSDTDKIIMDEIRKAKPDEIMKYSKKIQDKRLNELLLLFKARNYNKSLSDNERIDWLNHCKEKLLTGNPNKFDEYFRKISELSLKDNTSKQVKYLLEELRLYGQNLLLDLDN